MERIQAALQKAKAQQGAPWISEPPAAVAAASPRPASNTPWQKLLLREADLDVMSRNRIVTATRKNSAHAAFDILRTRVLQELRRNNWTSVAITSPTAGCGKTMVALNLAFSLANQKDCRTVLVDLDLKHPQVGKSLGLKDLPSMETFLKGESDVGDVFGRYGENIAIAGNGLSVRLTAELLQSPKAVRVLKGLKQRLNPDVILYDLPPMLANDDVMAFLPNVDCVILVAAAETTTMNEADICEHELSRRTNVLGVVLNKCRYTPDKFGY